MIGFIRGKLSSGARSSVVALGLVLVTALAASCAVDAPEGSPQPEAAQEGQQAQGLAMDDAEAMWGGLTYGGVYKYRGGPSVKSCTTGPMGVGLPNRFVHCYCEQMVKDCAQDSTCGTCSNARYEQCAYSRWFSSFSYYFGGCKVSELDECAAYCQTACSSSCAM